MFLYMNCVAFLNDVHIFSWCYQSIFRDDDLIAKIIVFSFLRILEELQGTVV